jgi:hypothetical protein
MRMGSQRREYDIDFEKGKTLKLPSNNVKSIGEICSERIKLYCLQENRWSWRSSC